MPIGFAQDKLQDRLIDEIKQIPNDKLAEVYDLLHYFRLGLVHGQQPQEPPSQRPIGLAKGMFEVPASFFEPLPDDLLDAFEGKP
ncbi:hypothetical protein CCR95_14490 [Thiocystis minor]|uniref:hypothetical protein n=1 Tax=Thiocystis minor TaxID=61597 RepID=UPI001913FA14|nr:hypothetical protein [Thiocystis minor]MBK5965262.1 hypothetical protein [Thiocystis minor]